MEIPLLKDIVVIFGLSIGVLLLCHRFGIPSIVGFLLTGVVCGPYGFGLVGAAHDVEVLAEIGIVLLLFSIGMDFSIRSLIRLKRYFLIGGTLQVVLTIIGGIAIAQFLGRPFGESIFLGCLLSLSSTAIVLGILEQKAEVATPHGRVIVAISIFQDIAAVPMILLTPFMAGMAFEFSPVFFKDVFLGLALILGVFISADKIIPRFLYYITRTRNKELFLLSVFVICLTVAWISSSIGLSLSIGAFLAGLTISESEYSNEAIGDILPFKDIFTSFFFVSIGMTLDWVFVMNQPFLIAFITIGIMCFKTITASFATLCTGMPLRTALLAGIALCQVGEFSFVLAKVGIDNGMGTAFHYQLFLAVALLSMALSPNLILFSPTIIKYILLLPIPQKLKTGLHPETANTETSKHHHVIIVGYGISGRYLSQACKVAKVPYVILEMNPETVKEEKKKGEPIHFGDASHDAVLRHANIQTAQVLAVVVSDPMAARHIVKVARETNPSLYIIVRTRYLQEVKLMHGLGADDVIADEFGTSVEIFSRVMNRYQVPKEELEKVVDEVRKDGIDILSSPYKTENALTGLKMDLSDVDIQSVRLEEGASLAGKTLSEAEFRKRYGMTVLLIRRGTDILTSLTAESAIRPDDIVVALGPKKSFVEIRRLFKAPVKG